MKWIHEVDFMHHMNMQCQLVRCSFIQSVGPSVGQSLADQSVGPSVGQSLADQSVGQSLGLSFGQSVSRLISQQVSYCI